MSDYYESRQHLNLSQLAYDVIENDSFVFHEKPSFTKMLNLVFEMYHDFANASIGIACSRYIEQLETRLESIPDSPEKDHIVSALTESYKNELIAVANSYPREHPFKIQLNRQNFDYLKDWREDTYDNNPGRFVKAVIEEYARKPFVDREGIVFRPLIERIDYSVANQLLLAITLQNGKRYEVRPYRVLVDQGNNYHYLVGYSRREHETDDRPSSFRISNIKSCDTKGGRSGRITLADKKALEDKIRTVGVQFLLQDPEIIRIRLSKAGKKMYESQVHLRPAFTKKKEDLDGSWIYEFNCTQIQARFYFLKFGAEAEVLVPESLREECAGRYLKALLLYKQ